MSRLHSAFLVLVMTTAACSPPTSGADAETTEDAATTVIPSTTSIVATTLTMATTITSSCSGIPDVGLAFLEWTYNGDPTRDVRAFPWQGFGPPWLRVVDETAERGARFYLRADPGDPRMLPSDDGGVYDAAAAVFARGVSLPENATFTGFATNWAELWLVPDNPDAAYIVPRTDVLFTEIERWPAMPSAGFCE